MSQNYSCATENIVFPALNCPFIRFQIQVFLINATSAIPKAIFHPELLWLLFFGVSEYDTFNLYFSFICA
jgi:hypothetical protein